MADTNIRIRIDGSAAAAQADRVKKSLKDVDTQSVATTRAVSLLQKALATIGAGMAASFVLKTLREFEQSIASVAAVTGATGEEFTLLRDRAKELGATTRYTAGDAAEAMRQLGQAGFSTNEIIAASSGVLALAQSGGLDLASASEIAANSLRGFRLQASQMNEVADLLTQASISATTNVQDLGTAFSYVAPISASLGVSMRETAAAVAALSDAGIGSSMAGASLRRVLSDLASPTKVAVREFEKYGITMDMLDVSVHGIIPVLQTLKDANLSVASAFQIFGQRGAPAFEVIDAALPKMIKWNEEWKNIDGVALHVAQTMDKNLNGAVLELVSAVENIIIQWSEWSGFTVGLEAALRGTADGIRFLTDNAQMLIPVITALMIKFAAPKLTFFNALSANFNDLRREGVPTLKTLSTVLSGTAAVNEKVAAANVKTARTEMEATKAQIARTEAAIKYRQTLLGTQQTQAAQASNAISLARSQASLKTLQQQLVQQQTQLTMAQMAHNTAVLAYAPAAAKRRQAQILEQLDIAKTNVMIQEQTVLRLRNSTAAVQASGAVQRAEALLATTKARVILLERQHAVAVTATTAATVAATVAGRAYIAVQSAMSGLMAAMGGPWGLALTAFAVGWFSLSGRMSAAEQQAQRLQGVFIELADAEKELTKESVELKKAQKSLFQAEQARIYNTAVEEVGIAMQQMAESVGTHTLSLEARMMSLGERLWGTSVPVGALADEMRRVTTEFSAATTETDRLAIARTGLENILKMSSGWDQESEALKTARLWMENLVKAQQSLVNTGIKTGTIIEQAAKKIDNMARAAELAQTEIDRMNDVLDEINPPTKPMEDLVEIAYEFVGATEQSERAVFEKRKADALAAVDAMKHAAAIANVKAIMALLNDEYAVYIQNLAAAMRFSGEAEKLLKVIPTIKFESRGGGGSGGSSSKKDSVEARLQDTVSLLQEYGYGVEQATIALKQYELAQVRVNNSLDPKNKQAQIDLLTTQVAHLQWQARFALVDIHKLLEQYGNDYEALVPILNKVSAAEQVLQDNYDETEGKIIELQGKMAGLNIAYQSGKMTMEAYQTSMVKVGLELDRVNQKMGNATAIQQFRLALGALVQDYEGVAKGLTDSFGQFFNSFADGFADATSRALLFGDSFSDSINEVIRNITQGLLSALIKIGVQWIANKIIFSSIASTTMAESVALAAGTSAVLTSLYATPAMLASIATFGGAAASGLGAFGSALATGNIIAMASVFKPFKSGGYTGDGNPNEVAGYVHKGEYVIPAKPTEQIGVNNLDKMVSGSYKSAPNNASTGQEEGGGWQTSRKPFELNVIVENYGSPKQFNVQQMDENTVRIIAQDEADRSVAKNTPDLVASQIANPNSTISKALSGSTTLSRRN